MSNDRQVTLTKCDYCGKYYEACNAHKCKKQPQQDKYIPCTHCAVQRCEKCDYQKLKEDRPVPAVLCNNDQCIKNGRGYCECDEIEIVEGTCCFFQEEDD